MLIFTGRFQPFHNGHLNLIKMLSDKYPNEKICIAVVRDFPLREISDFDKLANSALDKKRFLLSAEDSLFLIQKAIASFKLKNVVSTLMPRASDESWYIIDAMFDTERTWVFTQPIDENDLWEKAKQEYYRSKGEKTIFVPIRKDLSSTDIRKAVEEGNVFEIRSMVPDIIWTDLIRLVQSKI